MCTRYYAIFYFNELYVHILSLLEIGGLMMSTMKIIKEKEYLDWYVRRVVRITGAVCGAWYSIVVCQWCLRYCQSGRTRDEHTTLIHLENCLCPLPTLRHILPLFKPDTSTQYSTSNRIPYCTAQWSIAMLILRSLSVTSFYTSHSALGIFLEPCMTCRCQSHLEVISCQGGCRAG